MAIFIISSEGDLHGDRIEWGLRYSGFEVFRWQGLGWLPQHSGSIRFGRGDGVYLANRRIGSEDTVWLRRPSTNSHPDVDEYEAKFAAAEYRAFRTALLTSIEWSGALCINKCSAVRAIENKSVQLLAARECGLLIPETLMTNNSAFVRGFLGEAEADIVHKAFLPHAWFHEATGRIELCESTRLDRYCKLPDETFALAPGIYQQTIVKGYDVRIHLIHGDLHSFAITTPNKVLDWRKDSLSGGVSLERVKLPADVEAGLRRFAQRVDIVFGCFDMVVDDSGQWWFLEVNQAGQFLWVDDLQPEDGLYQPMLRFLSAREGPPKRVFPTYEQCLSECANGQLELTRKDSPFITVDRTPAPA